MTTKRVKRPSRPAGGGVKRLFDAATPAVMRCQRAPRPAERSPEAGKVPPNGSVGT